MVEFVNLEFGAHGFLINHVFLPTEQAETNICWIIYQDASFKICLSLFGWKENIVPKMHIVQWCIILFYNVLDEIFLRSGDLDLDWWLGCFGKLAQRSLWPAVQQRATFCPHGLKYQTRNGVVILTTLTDQKIFENINAQSDSLTFT